MITLIPQPEPMTCTRCGHVANWVLDLGDAADPWELDSEWWIGSDGAYLCKRWCWLRHEGVKP